MIKIKVGCNDNYPIQDPKLITKELLKCKNSIIVKTSRSPWDDICTITVVTKDLDEVMNAITNANRNSDSDRGIWISDVRYMTKIEILLYNKLYSINTKRITL